MAIVSLVSSGGSLVDDVHRLSPVHDVVPLSVGQPASLQLGRNHESQKASFTKTTLSTSSKDQSTRDLNTEDTLKIMLIMSTLWTISREWCRYGRKELTDPRWGEGSTRLGSKERRAILLGSMTDCGEEGNGRGLPSVVERARGEGREMRVGQRREEGKVSGEMEWWGRKREGTLWRRPRAGLRLCENG